MKINNHKKNHLDLYQVQKCPNVILNALAILLEAFFNIFLPTDRHECIALPSLAWPAPIPHRGKGSGIWP